MEIDGTEEQMDTEGMKAGEADTPIELVDLTNVSFVTESRYANNYFSSRIILT